MAYLEQSSVTHILTYIIELSYLCYILIYYYKHIRTLYGPLKCYIYIYIYILNDVNNILDIIYLRYYLI